MTSRFSRFVRSNFKNVSVIFFVLIALFSFTACEEPQAPIEEVIQGPAIRGVIDVPAGSGVSSSSIWIQVYLDGEVKKTVKAKDDFTFVVDGLEKGKSYDILATTQKPSGGITEIKSISRDIKDTDGFGGWIIDQIPTEGGTSIGNLILKPLGTIKGTVTKKGEYEHYDIFISIPGTSFTAVTDENGNFSMYNVPQGSYKVRFKADNYLPYMVDEVVITSGEESLKHPVKTLKPVELVKEAGSVEGAVSVGDRDTYAGVSVSLVSSTGARITVTTPSSGIFRFEDVKPGTYHIEAYIPDYRTVFSGEFNVVSGQLYQIPEKLELFNRISTVTGSVSLSGSDIREGISILFQDINDPRRSYSAITDVDGKFTKLVMPGTYKVTASYAGYTSQSIEVEAIIDTVIPVRFPILLPSTGGISGRVVLEGLVDMSGSTVTIKSIDGAYTDSKPVDKEGRFLFSGLNKVCSYYLYATHDGYVTSGEKLVDVSLGNITPVEDVVLKSVASPVRGKVELDGTDSFTGIQVMLTDGKRQYDATTSQIGEYLFPAVMPGTYTMYVSMSGYESRTVEGITIEPSNPKQLDSIKLPIAIKSVTGKIQLELSADHSGALVTATNTSNEQLVYSAITNSDGTFTLAGMVAGNYNIVISMPSYNTVSLPTLTVDGIAMENIKDVITVPIARGTITGVATLEGWTNHEGIKVELMKGTEVYDTTTTSSSGSYSFYVPEGNYSGVRLSKVDFADTEVSKLIAIFSGDAASVGNTELKATHVTIKGSVNIYGITEKRQVEVLIENTKFSSLSDADGLFEIPHVPLSMHSCSLIFRLENAPDVVKRIGLHPDEFIEIEKVTMLPNSGIAVGRVNLKGMKDHGGVTVLATPKNPGVAKVETVTDPAGYFRVSNLITSEAYTLTFSKNGWICDQSIDVSGLVPLDEKDVTGVVPVELVDNTIPVIDSLFVNWGNSYVEGKSLYVTMSASDEGNYVETVEYAFNENFTDPVKIPYKRTFEIPLPDGDGTISVFFRVYDPSGNVSAIKSSTLEYANYRYEVKGVLGGKNLHWTKENSPYYVTGNLLVENGKELIIDPGVEVRVLAGDDGSGYFIQVEGKLTAIGTPKERIKFYGYDTGVGRFQGIYGKNSVGSSICYADIYDAEIGVYGNIDIRNMEINAAKALGKDFNSWSEIEFYGKADNVVCNGCIFCGNGCVLNNMKIKGSASLDIVRVINVEFGDNVSLNASSCVYSTFNSNLSMCESSLTYSELNGVTFSEFKNSLIMENNMINCGTITVNTRRSDRELVSLRNNFWGYDKTQEMNESSDGNYTFINDYYDDFNITKVDCSDYKADPIKDIGYQKNGVVKREPAASYQIGDIGPAGGIIFYVDEADEYPGWTYMEAMLGYEGIGRYPFGYYRDTPEGSNQIVGTDTGIGTGKANTDKLVAVMEDTAYTNYDGAPTYTDRYAAKVCYDYVQFGYDDWFMPSKDELNLLYLNVQKDNRIYSDSYFWASSERNDGSAWDQGFGNGNQSIYHGRGDVYNVCPVRAF